MQNFHDGPPIPQPGEDKEHEATMDTELSSTEDIQPLPVQEPAQESDIRQLIREECFVEVHEEQKQTGISHSILSSKVTSHSLGIGKRFSALDSVTSSDSVSGVMVRCSYPILNKCSGSLVDRMGATI
nr:hypothetical protein [Tanacetum cinerariifolium]